MREARCHATQVGVCATSVGRSGAVRGSVSVAVVLVETCEEASQAFLGARCAELCGTCETKVAQALRGLELARRLVGCIAEGASQREPWARSAAGTGPRTFRSDVSQTGSGLWPFPSSEYIKKRSILPVNH